MAVTAVLAVTALFLKSIRRPMVAYEDSHIELHGVNGDRITLHGVGAGAQGIVLGEEPDGLFDSPFDTRWDQGASQIGATYRGKSRPPRDITGTVHCHGANSAEIRRVTERLRKAVGSDGHNPATLQVTTPMGRRRLLITPTKDPKPVGRHDPNSTGYAGRIVQWRAADPDYRGNVLTSGWVFNGVDYVGSVTVANPGDQPVALRWVITSPASWILPDHSFAPDASHPDWEHRNRMVALPFQRWHSDPARRQDASIQIGLADLQGKAVDGHQFQARWAGQSFIYMLPPHTEPTQIPVAINPLPWAADIWARLKIPGTLPADVLFEIAKALSAILGPIGTDTVLSWTPEQLIERIDAALSRVTPSLIEPWIEALRTALRLPTAGELISNTYGSVSNMAGAAVKVYAEPLYSTPWED